MQFAKHSSVLDLIFLLLLEVLHFAFFLCYFYLSSLFNSLKRHDGGCKDPGFFLLLSIT